MQETASAPTSTGASLGFAAIAAAAALWAVAAAVARDLFDGGLDPLELVQARAYITVAGLALLPAAWRRPRDRPALAGAVALGLSIALVNATYYLAIDHLDVAVAIVIQYTAPALVVIWVAGVARRTPAPDVLLSVALALLGVVLVSGVATEGLGKLDAFGLAMGALTAVMFATYTLVSEKVGAVYGVRGALLRGFAWASLAWIAFQIPRGFPDELVAQDNIGRVLFVGIGGTLVPFLLFLWGVQRVRAERAVIGATLEPVLAALVAWVWLDQSLTPIQLLGGLIVIAAVVSLQVRRTDAAETALVPEP